MNNSNNRNYIIKLCIEGKIPNHIAAQKIGISIRHVTRLKSQYISERSLSRRHGNTGNTHHKTIKDEDIEYVLKRYNELKHLNVNFKHFHSIVEREGTMINYMTLVRPLKSNGYKSPQKHRKKKIYKRRTRREHFGELLQTDATPHAWFYGDRKGITCMVS